MDWVQVNNFLAGFNLQTIISVLAIAWYFTRDIKTAINNLDRDIREMNTRISRVEGTVYGANIYQELKKEEKKC
jgi:hypothetical protein